jgi:hypothetical protein
MLKKYIDNKYKQQEDEWEAREQRWKDLENKWKKNPPKNNPENPDQKI